MASLNRSICLLSSAYQFSSCSDTAKEGCVLPCWHELPAQDTRPPQAQEDLQLLHGSQGQQHPYSDATKTTHENFKVKRPLNAFIVFFHYEPKKIIEVQPDIHNADISKRLGRSWKELTEKEKSPYIQEAEQLPAYKYQPKKKVKVSPPTSVIDSQI